MTDLPILLPLFCLILLAVGWSSAYRLLQIEQVAAKRAAMQNSRELADTYEAQLQRNLVYIDQTLRMIEFNIKHSPHTPLREYEAKGLLPPALIFTLGITDARGIVRDSNGDRRLDGTSVAGSAFFRDARRRALNGGNGWRSSSVITRATNRSGNARAQAVVLPKGGDEALAEGAGTIREISQASLGNDGRVTFSLPLHDATGRFIGVVLLCMDSAYFTSGYDNARMGDAGLLLLATRDAKVRAAQIGSQVEWHDALIGPDAGKVLRDPSDAVSLVRWGDGTTRFTSVRPLSDFALTAVVGLSVDEQMSGYRASKKKTYLWTGLASIGLLLLTGVLSRMSWQLARSRRNTRQIERTYFAASEASLDGFLMIRTVRRGLKGRVAFIVTAASGRATQLLGETPISLIGQRIEADASQADVSGSYASFLAVATTGLTRATEWLHKRVDGSQIWLHRQVVRVEDGLVAIIRDISEQKSTDVRRVNQNRLLEMIATSTPLDKILVHLIDQLDAQIDSAQCAVLLCAADGRTLRVGALGDLPVAFRDFAEDAPIGPFAGPAGRTIHFRTAMHVSRHDDADFDAAFARCGLHDHTDCWAFPVLAHSKSPHDNERQADRVGALQLHAATDARPLAALIVFRRDARLLIDAEKDAIAAATRLIGIAVERAEVESTIHHMAKHDALTGLPNRVQLSERLDEVLAQARVAGGQVTVVFIDLDNFKLINDSLGHHAGDALLVTVARRMTMAVNPVDMVVRLGGDEFVLVLSADMHEGDGLLRTVAHLHAVIADPVQLLGEEFRVSASMGSARFPEDGDDAQTLLMHADAAMYRAKEGGRNTWRAYTADMNAQVHDKLRLKESLRHALDDGELQLVYQPQVDLAGSRIFGMEALLRWHHPRHGTVMPADFVPFAEENGLIVPIGAWVLDAACRQNKAWQDAGYEPIIMSVNVSARQFADDGLTDAVSDALRKSGLDPAYLELEITESVIMLDVPRAVARMRYLEKMGVRLSIDDFGTGYSSLSALKSFPIARLKLDQSFVHGISDNSNDQTIARAVVALCRQLNLEVIAEGVETWEQLTFLMENGCSAIQGFWFSKPLDGAAAGALLARPFTLPIDASQEWALPFAAYQQDTVLN